MIPLSPKRRSELRSEAHKLSPVVIIGDKGLTDEVIAEIDRSLKAHELIKVRAATDERDARAVWIETICDRLEAHPVQQIGKIFVIYRENAEEKHSETRQKTPAGQRNKKADVVSDRGKLRQRARDLDKQRAADVKDMVRKGKIKLKAEIGSTAGGRGDETRTPSAPADPATPRRRPRTSR